MFTDYSFLVALHSLFRWVVLLAILYAIFTAYRGYANGATFAKSDNAIRHWTATIAHIQLVIGITLYIKSDTVKYFWKNLSEAFQQPDTLFFGLIHFILMLSSVVFLTVGSAMAKRKKTDKEKFKTMLIWFSLALFIIFIAIPWSFSPLAHRPYIRQF